MLHLRFLSVLYVLAAQRDRTTQWWTHDNEKTFASLKPGTTPYGLNDITYAHNSVGFRCDELTEHSDFPVLFLGCSHTYGAGLPLEDVWAYHIFEKIQKFIGGKIAYWNLGIVGAGLDILAEILYLFSQLTKTIPRLIITLFPDSFRRVSSYGRPVSCMWMPQSPHVFPKLFPKSSPEIKTFFDDNFAKYQSCRSLMLIDQSRAMWDSVLIGDTWSYADRKLYRHFPNFNMINNFPDESYVKSMARDGMHWGPEMHEEIAARYWPVVEEQLKSI